MRPFVALVPLTVLAACITLGGGKSDMTGPTLRPALDAPTAFVTEDGGHPERGCRSPLLDPRDGGRLRMARSGTDRGDYEVPEGRYGVDRGELLRIHCPTGRPVGVVRR